MVGGGPKSQGLSTERLSGGHVGGHGGDDGHGGVGAHDGAWESALPMRSMRVAASAVVQPNGSILVLGGKDVETGCGLSTSEVLTGGVWKVGPPLTAPRSYACAIAVGDVVWLCGGYDSMFAASSSVRFISCQPKPR